MYFISRYVDGNYASVTNSQALGLRLFKRLHGRVHLARTPVCLKLKSAVRNRTAPPGSLGTRWIGLNISGFDYHSFRSATMGWSLAARSAGTHVAPKAISSIKPTVAEIVIGSNASIP